MYIITHYKIEIKFVSYNGLQLTNNMRSISKTYNSVYPKKDDHLYCIDIDFDEASRAWRANKKSIGNGHY